MATKIEQKAADGPSHRAKERVLTTIREFYEGRAQLRRGLCLLRAGQIDAAIDALHRAKRLGCSDRTLPSLLASALCATSRGSADEMIPECVNASGTDEIQQAHLLWVSGRPGEAIATLREAIQADSERAELHYQLGLFLTQVEQYEEAELRFEQAINIEPHHASAAASLAMCCGVRGAPGEAVRHLRAAQARRPFDGRIALLLAQAVKAASGNGSTLRAAVPVDVPDEATDYPASEIEELASVIRLEPDFVDAFLAIPRADVDDGVFAMLLRTLHAAMEHEPERADLLFHCGRVLDRLGDSAAATTAEESAVALDPKFTRALIELAKLYRRTDRTRDAAERLEQAVAAGADYADVHCMLGQLYQKLGDAAKALNAFARALEINEDYAEARAGLALVAEPA